MIYQEDNHKNNQNEWDLDFLCQTWVLTYENTIKLLTEVCKCRDHGHKIIPIWWIKYSEVAGTTILPCLSYCRIPRLLNPDVDGACLSLQNLHIHHMQYTLQMKQK